MLQQAFMFVIKAQILTQVDVEKVKRSETAVQTWWYFAKKLEDVA